MASTLSVTVMAAIRDLWDTLFSEHFPDPSHPAMECVAENSNIGYYAIAAFVICFLVLFFLYAISKILLISGSKSWPHASSSINATP